MQEANTGINNLLNAIQQGILTKSTKTRLEELEAARDELENKIALEKLAKPRVSEEQVRYFLHRFRALDIAKPEQRKTLIDVFLNAMYVFNDKIVISCNYKDGTKTINFSDMECALTPRASIPGSDLDCPGAAPSAQDDPLRSNAKGDSRPLSRSPHADPKVGSDLDCPGAPRQNNTIRSSAAARRRPVDRWCCFSFPNRRTHGVFQVCMISLLRCCRQVPVIASPAPPWTRLPACRAGSGRHRPAALFR